MIFWKGAIHKWWHPFFEIFYLSSVFITHFTNRLMEVTFWQIPLPPEWVTSFMNDPQFQKSWLKVSFFTLEYNKSIAKCIPTALISFLVCIWVKYKWKSKNRCFKFSGRLLVSWWLLHWSCSFSISVTKQKSQNWNKKMFEMHK